MQAVALLLASGAAFGGAIPPWSHPGDMAVFRTSEPANPGAPVSASLSSPATPRQAGPASGAVAALSGMSAPVATGQGAMTLQEAVRLAISRSVQVAGARARLAQSRARTGEVWASVYPQISLGGSLMRLDLLGGGTAGLGGLGGLTGLGGLGGQAGLSAPGSYGGTGGQGGVGSASVPGGGGSGTTAGGTDLANLGMPGPGGVGGLGGGPGGIGGIGSAGSLSSAGYHQIQGTVTVNQIVFDGMRTQAGLALADLQERLGRTDLESAGRRSVIETATAYFQVLRAEEILAMAVRAAEEARRQLERAEIRLRTGTGMKLDVLQARASLAAFRVQQSAAENAARRARVGLSALLGEEISAKLAPASLPKADVDLERDLPSAIASRPETIQLDLKIAMDREQVTIQERSAWPTAAVFGTLSWQGGGGSRYDALGLQANWPIFDAGRVRSRVEQAKAELEADRAARQGLARSIEAEIRRALLDRQDARERVAMAGEGLEAAREALRLAEVRYQTGAGTMFDVSDAHHAVVRAETDAINARYEVELAEVRLVAALGLPLSNLGLEVDFEATETNQETPK